MKNKSLIGVGKIVNYGEIYLTTLPTDNKGQPMSDRHLVINLIHNRKDIKVGDKISIEDNFCDLYDYEVLEVGDCELVVFELWKLKQSV